MKTFPVVVGSIAILLVGWVAAVAAETAAQLYEQKMDLVYGEVHGTGLLMDVFTPKGKANGLGIVDVVSGAYYSDRNKIRDHTMAQVYPIFCSRGYTVFAIRPGSRTRYTGSEMDAHVKTGIRYVKLHAAEYKIDPERLGLTGASAGGHLATLAAVTPEEAKPEASSPLLRHSTKVKAAAIFFPPTDFLDWDGKPADLKTLGDLLFPDDKTHSEDEIKERARSIRHRRRVSGRDFPYHARRPGVVAVRHRDRHGDRVRHDQHRGAQGALLPRLSGASTGERSESLPDQYRPLRRARERGQRALPGGRGRSVRELFGL